MLDRLTFIRSFGCSSPSVARYALQQYLNFVTSPSVRLCLRAQGVMPSMLEAIRDAAARGVEPGENGGTVRISSSCWWLHACILEQLSVESAGREELLEHAACDLQHIAMAAASREGVVVRTASQDATLERESCSSSALASMLNIKESQETVSGNANGPLGLLKRKRSHAAVSATHSHEISSGPQDVEFSVQRITHLLASVNPLAEYCGPTAASVALLVLQRCLPTEARRRARRSVAEDLAASVSTRIVKGMMMLLFKHGGAWARHMVGFGADVCCREHMVDGMHVSLLLDIMTSCVATAASFDPDEQHCTIDLAWVILCCLLAFRRCGSSKIGRGALGAVVGEAPATAATPACSCLVALPDVASSCLRLLYRVTQAQPAWASKIVVTRHSCSAGASAVFLGATPAEWQARWPSLLAVLVDTLAAARQEHPAIPAVGRLSLGILSNLASECSSTRHQLSAFAVEANFPHRLLAGVLHAPGSSSTQAEKALLAVQVDRTTHPSFLEALARSFAVRQRQLFVFDPHGEDVGYSRGCAEARVNCALAGVLLSWLMEGQPEAQAYVKSSVGNLDQIADMLRQFVIFQDQCGALTDVSLVELHAVMSSLASSDRADFSGDDGCGVTKTPTGATSSLLA